MPTLSKLAGYESAKDLQWEGRDAWPVQSGAGKAEPRALYWPGAGRKSRAVRHGDLKLILHQWREPERYD